MRAHAHAPSPSLSILFAVIATAACGDGARHTPTPPGVVDLGGVDTDGGSTDAGGADSGTASGDLGTADLGERDLGMAAIAPPDGVGPYAVTTTSATVAGSMVTVFEPTLPSDARAPVAVFLPGFQLTVSQYAAICERLASHGMIVVGVDGTGGFSPDHVMLRDAAIAALDWALATAPSAARSDGTRVLVFGHSLGGKLSTMMAGTDGRVTALLGIDPVNGGGGPGSGYSASRPDIVPDGVAPLTIPVGFIGETTNGAGGFMPCAPADQNFQTFYAAATGASWAAQWDFIGADHMDFVADTAGCLACGFCTAGTADPAAVLRSTMTIVVAFAQRHLLGVAGAEEWLTGPSLPSGIVLSSRP